MTKFDINTDSLMYSSMLDEITVSTDLPYLDIFLKSDKGGVIFNQRYWAYADNITLWDISYVIENFMRQAGVVILDDLTFSASYEGSVMDSVKVRVLYCESLPDDKSSFDYENQFLTTSSHRRVVPDSSVFLCAYGYVTETFSVSFKYRIAGQSAICQDSLIDLTYEDFDNIKILKVSIRDMQTYVSGLYSDINWWQIEICSFNVICGNRYAQFTVDKSLANGHIFYFRNCFNCPDFLMLSAVTKEKTEVERSLAIFGARAVFYDQTTEKNYDVETAPLMNVEGEFIDQLISSPEVYKIIPQINKTFLAQLILITESNCEIADDDKLDSVKYTWRYADNRLHRHISADSLLRIFTYQFNPSFT